ncbi:hypothetical protein ACKFKF_11810 [Phormidesmis sp. 146-12]
MFVAWFFLGFTASHAFPIDLVKSFISYLFSGFQTHKLELNKAVSQSLNLMWQEARSTVNNMDSLETVIATGDKHEASELNKLDSKYWLLSRIVELLAAGISAPDKDLVDWRLSELGEKRDFILSRLHPLKRKHYTWLSRIEDSWQYFYAVLTLQAIKREKELSIFERSLTSLVIFYIHREPSKENIQEMLEALDDLMARNPRLKPLHQTSRLFNWVYSCIEKLATDIQEDPVQEDPVYKEYPVRARREKPCYHLPNGCTHYPRVEKAEDPAEILFFKTIGEAEAQNLDLCGSCRRILRLGSL